MNRSNRLSSQLAGTLLIIGPGLVVCAALLAAAGIGTITGRWYDNWLEGILMAAGFSLQLVGLLELCRRIGAVRPVLGVLTTLTSALGTMGVIFPSATRYISSAELAAGITMDQLDAVHAGRDEAALTSLVLILFIFCFFLNYFLLAFGLWRSRIGPRYTPILLVVGSVMYFIAQGTSFEVIMPLYISGAVVWLLGLAPLGMGLLREAGGMQQAPAGAASRS